MITKFLYQMNVVNKRIITGCVENDIEEEYDAFKEIPMILENTYTLEAGERKVSNFGKLYYGVFRHGDTYRYVNLNDYMLKVKVDASPKAQFATPLSKDCLNSILFNTNYLDQDINLEFIESGYSLEANLEYDDKYRSLFKKVDDDQYVEFIDEDEVSYLTKKETATDSIYDIVFDFKDASLIYKKELRPILFTHKFIGEKASTKSNIYMSHYNIFKNFETNEYLFAGDNSFKVLFDNTKVVFERNPEITNKFRLVNDEARNLALRDILNIVKHSNPRGSHIVTINNLYLVKTNDSTYELRENASIASLIDDDIIDIIKNIVKLYSEDVRVRVLGDTTDEYYLYYDNNSYELSHEKKNNLKSKLVRKDAALNFIQGFENFKNNGDTLLIENNKYVSINYSNNNFTLEFLNSAYNASKFTKEEVVLLEQITSKKFNKREINKISDITNHYNLSNNEILSVEESYKQFLQIKQTCGIRFSNNLKPLNELKVGSDKASFEYLESLYVKACLDTEYVVSKIINKVNNILVIGSTSTLDLYGIALASSKANKTIHVSMLDTCKWGYYPPVSLGNNVVLDGTYRLEAESLTKDFVNQFDCILISKKFSGNKEGILDLISNLERDSYKGLIVNISYTNELNMESDFSSIVKEKTNFKKYLPHFDVDSLRNTYGSLAIVDNNISYYSIFRIKNNKIVDAIKAK